MSDSINVTVTPAPAIMVALEGGQQGPAGPQGIQGPPGPAGDSSYRFTQSTPASTWNIAHNLDRYPSVTVVDSSGREVDGDLDYVDGNNLTLVFSAPFSGVAYLN